MFRATYNDIRQWQQGGLWVTNTFAGTGSANTLTQDVTFARPFAVTPAAVSLAHNVDPTNVAIWATNVTTAGFTINVYRLSGTGALTVRWVADAPTQ